MKYFIFLLILISCEAFGQISPNDSTKSKLKTYFSLGLSIGNVDQNNPELDNFSKSSYPSFELGIMGENLSLGAVFGAENIFVSSSTRSFYEMKTSFFKSMGKVSPYALFGIGAYFESNFNPFIEYGGGFTYMPQKLGFFVQYSNWAKTNYVSTGCTYAF
jgi:hypothetical protein